MKTLPHGRGSQGTPAVFTAWPRYNPPVKTATNITLRRARIPDVPVASKIINDYAELGLMLHRSLAFLYEHLRDFQVAVVTDERGGAEESVIGIAGLNIVWANVAEVYSVAVMPAFHGMGVGKRLVQATLDEAAELGIRRVISLTYEEQFFARLGFVKTDRQALPLKMWSECVRCSKHQACDEIAMVRVIESVPEAPTPPPYHPPPGEYTVPVTIERTKLEARPKMDEAH